MLETDVWAGILMEFIPGKHAETYSETLLHQMAVYQARMHTEGLNYASKVSPTNTLKTLVEEEFSPHVPDVALQDEELKGFVERAKAFRYEFDINLPYGFSHFDYDTGNVLVNDEAKITGILDFDDLTYAPVVMCLAYTLWDILFTTGDQELARQYIVLYETIRPLSNVEKMAIPHIILFRHYAIGCLDILRGTINGNQQKYLELEAYLKTANF
jgi:Ser/Thr protein kinase RdoA (MazF antagonist)